MTVLCHHPRMLLILSLCPTIATALFSLHIFSYNITAKQVISYLLFGYRCYHLLGFFTIAIDSLTRQSLRYKKCF